MCFVIKTTHFVTKLLFGNIVKCNSDSGVEIHGSNNSGAVPDV